ncbi:34298_t:CDS:2, partial [Racocetra persica]
ECFKLVIVMWPVIFGVGYKYPFLDNSMFSGDAKMADITLNYRVSSDYSINIPPNTTVANLKNMIRNNVLFTDFDLYINDTARE